MWSFGRFVLGLTDKQFWHLTLAQFNALAKRYLGAEERQDWRAGQICAVIANVNRDPKKRTQAYEAKDFMPSRRQQKKPLSDKQMLDQIMIANAALGGEVKDGR